MTVPSIPPVFSEETLDLIAARFRVLGEPSRLRLVRALEAGERSVGGLVEATGLSQTNTSRHLATLTDAGILGRRREGLNVIYYIADPGILDLCHHVCGSLARSFEARAEAFRAPSRRESRRPRARRS